MKALLDTRALDPPIEFPLFEGAMAVFGLKDRAAMLLAPVDVSVRTKWLSELKSEAKQRYKSLLLEDGIHPDKGGSDEGFNAVKIAFDFIQEYKIALPRRSVCPTCSGVGHIEFLVTQEELNRDVQRT